MSFDTICGGGGGGNTGPALYVSFEAILEVTDGEDVEATFSSGFNILSGGNPPQIQYLNAIVSLIKQ